MATNNHSDLLSSNRQIKKAPPNHCYRLKTISVASDLFIMIRFNKLKATQVGSTITSATDGFIPILLLLYVTVKILRFGYCIHLLSSLVGTSFWSAFLVIIFIFFNRWVTLVLFLLMNNECVGRLISPILFW